MNRSALNTTVLGVGSKIPLSFVSAAQALYLIVSAGAHVIKSASFSQTLALGGSQKATIRRMMAVAQTMSLQYHADVHAWVKVYAQAVQNFALSTSSKATRILHAVVVQTLLVTCFGYARLQQAMTTAQSFVMNGVATLRTAIRATASRAMSLTTSITAFDITTTPANDERTTVVPVDNRVTIVPGESYESGV